MTDERPVAVLAALTEEATPLGRRIGRGARRRPEWAPPPGVRAWSGRSGRTAVRVVVTGDGEAHARRGGRAALADRPSALFVVGVAGALDGALAPGDLVVAHEVCAPDGTRHPADPDLIERVARATGAVPASVVTSERLAGSPEARRELRARWSVPGDADRGGAPYVVDLESAHYVAEARSLDVPWVVLRVVSDGVAEPLPPFLEACRDAGGGIRRGRVALRCLVAPWWVPALLRLGLRARGAGGTLAGAVEAALAAGVVGRHETSAPGGGA